MLNKVVCDEIGWLAPNGDYYPCTSGTMKNHIETAREIIQEVFGLDPDNIPGDYPMRLDMTIGLDGFKSYGFLFAQGYVRVDTESIEPQCPLTFEQLVTLSKMVRIDMRGGINHKLIQQVIDKNNTHDCDGGTYVERDIPQLKVPRSFRR